MFAETLAQYRAMCAKCLKAPVVSVDTETTGLDYHKDTVVGGSTSLPGAKEGTFFMLPKAKERVALGKVLGSKGIVKVFHNAKFDMHMLRHAGIATLLPIEDTYVLMHLLDENRRAYYSKGKSYKLKELAKEYVSEEAGESQDKLKAWLEKEGKTISQLSSAPKSLLAEYGANDALITLQLRDILRNKLGEDGIPEDLIQREMEILYIAYLMEEEGAHVDLGFLKKYSKELEREQSIFLRDLNKFVPVSLPNFNPESDENVASVLIALGVPLTEKTALADKWKVDKGVLEKIQHPFAKTLMEYRRIATIRQTFVQGIFNRAIGDKIHAEFDTAGTTTGRLSCRNPNLQNLDSKSQARQAFVPKKGHEFWSFDLKQIEPCILAHFVKSPEMTHAFQQGWDFHTFNASIAFKTPYEDLIKDLKEPENTLKRKNAEAKRKRAKTLGLAIMYQAGGKKVAEGMGVPEAEGRRILADFYKAMPEVKKFQRDTTDIVIRRALEEAKQLGKASVSPEGLLYNGKLLPKRQVPKPGQPGEFWEFPDYDGVEEIGWIVNPFGRKRRLRCNDAYKAGNALIQGTAADFFKECTVVIWKELGIIPVFSIHDELIYEFKKGLTHQQEKIITIIKECGKKWFPEIPIRVDVAKSAKSLYYLEEVV